MLDTRYMQGLRSTLLPELDRIKDSFIQAGMGFTIVLTAHAGNESAEVYNLSQGPDGRKLMMVSETSHDMMTDGRFTGHPMEKDERW